jgi:fructose-1,6-bisphosphatase II
MLRGVRFTENHAITHTVVMRGTTGTVRFIEAYHDYDKKPSYVKVK